MNSIVYKNRERLVRGPLINFNDLPLDKQDNFIKIKEFLIKYFNENVDVYVYGSFLHGYWDDLSDYDILIYKNYDGKKLDNLILDKLKLNVNVNCTENKIGIILIP